MCDLFKLDYWLFYSKHLLMSNLKQSKLSHKSYYLNIIIIIIIFIKGNSAIQFVARFLYKNWFALTCFCPLKVKEYGAKKEVQKWHALVLFSSSQISIDDFIIWLLACTGITREHSFIIKKNDSIILLL